MYIEIRKNAIYLKESKWDKMEKKTKSSSTYLGSDCEQAKAKLETIENVEKSVIEELCKAQEKYAYDRAITALEKLSSELGVSKAQKQILTLIEKLTKAQNKCADKSQKDSDYKSQNKCDYSSQKDCADKSQKDSAEFLESQGQTVLPITGSQSQKDCDNESQNTSDCQAQRKCDKCGTDYQPIPKRDGGTFMGCPNWSNHK